MQISKQGKLFKPKKQKFRKKKVLSNCNSASKNSKLKKKQQIDDLESYYKQQVKEN